MTDAPPEAKCERCGDRVRAGAKLCFTCASTMAVPFPSVAVGAPAAEVSEGPGTCPRCGTFATLRAAMGRTVCDECHLRLLHPVAREPADVASLVRGTYRIAIRVFAPGLFVSLGAWIVLSL